MQQKKQSFITYQKKKRAVIHAISVDIVHMKYFKIVL